MGGLITCGYIDINILFPILSGLFPVVCTYLLIKTKAKFINFDFIFAFISSASLSISLIPYLISKKLSKSSQSFNKSKEFNKFKKFLFIIMTSALDYIATLMYVFSNYNNINLWFLDFFIIGIFSRFILKTHLYRHHYFCIVVILICGLGLYIIQTLNFKPKYIDILKCILFETTKSFGLVLNKYVMEYQFCSAYELCFYIGFFEMIFIGIFHIFFYFFKYNYINVWKEYNKMVNFKDICSIIIYCLIYFIYNLMYLIAIKKYNAFCSLIIVSITEIGFIFLKLSKFGKFVFQL